MKESSRRKVLEPQKASLLCAWVGEISPKRIEWKKVNKNRGEDLIKLGVLVPIKEGTSYPAKQPSKKHDQAFVKLLEDLLKPPILLSPYLPFFPHQNLAKFPYSLALNLCFP